MKKHAIKAYKEIELNRAADNPLKNLVKIFELVKKKNLHMQNFKQLKYKLQIIKMVQEHFNF